MSAFAPPPLHYSEALGSRTLRFGTAIGTGTAAALACTVPATIRVGDVVASAGGLPRIWLALAAASLVPMVAAVIVLRGARDGLRVYVGPDMGLRTYGVALWLLSLLVTFALFGSILRATTHQHALAGVTFAFGAVALAAGSALVCARIVFILRGLSSGVRYAIASLIALIALAACARVVRLFLHAVAQDPTSAIAGGTVVDVALFTLTAVFAALPSLAPQRVLAVVGPPVALLVAVLGVITLRNTPIREAIDQDAPAFAPVADLVQSP